MVKCQVSSSKKYTMFYFPSKPRSWVHGFTTIKSVLEGKDSIVYFLRGTSIGGRSFSKSSTSGKWTLAFPIGKFHHAISKFGIAAARYNSVDHTITIDKTKGLPPVRGERTKKESEPTKPPNEAVRHVQDELKKFHPERKSQNGKAEMPINAGPGYCKKIVAVLNKAIKSGTIRIQVEPNNLLKIFQRKITETEML